MPPRIPRACRKSGCPKTTTDRRGYCTDHIHTGWQYHQQGRSRHERGYGSQWDKLKTRVKQRDNFLCQHCLRQGRVVTGTTVDHIQPKAHGGTDALSNLQLLCEACHRQKTATERLRRD
ncbi:HNH endonuclease [Xenorhabdus sp. PB30.3]|uniref:HNH endonuclease n=1 Tax=Xenorhabdus sp. PB30.3 TaxID=2788941 RepID=UPI001E3A6AC2|nr:HNH endonuclease signature motif containing protein [Xenorhabdus sp. PB30.3]MCC8381544.1 HNH endonuclease [Xenorhabdus sp. PB30.3]